MNYYLIDFENIKNEDIAKITETNVGDKIIIFYSEKRKNITLDIIENITRKNLQFSCYKATTGTKNALDFQLSSYLGYLIGKSENNEKYYIVSNDKGYDCLCDYWKSYGKDVTRISLSDTSDTTDNSTQTNQPKNEKKQKNKNNIITLEEITNVLSKEDNPEEILKIFNQNKTKQTIYNGISKKVKDSKKAGTIYKKLKPLFTEKNKK